MHAKQAIHTFMDMPETKILLTQIKFWEYLTTDTFYTLQLQYGLRFRLGLSEINFFQISIITKKWKCVHEDGCQS